MGNGFSPSLAHLQPLSPSLCRSQPYAKTYAEGNEAYSRQEYATVIRKMEDALGQYFKAEEDCRLQCEDALQKPLDNSPHQGVGGWCDVRGICIVSVVYVTI